MSVTQPLLAERYRLVRSLGQGGMGRVWLARDEVLHRDVAIKEVVPPEGLTAQERDEMRRRTLREARAAARLSHPSVVRVYDVVRTDVHPWIVMEYVPSRSLHQVINEDGTLPPARAAQIGLQVLGALRAAHLAGVLHRDVKPSNVLLTDEGRVVLTDFGLAIMAGEATVTRPGMVLGSPAYIAPERARQGVTGPESDLWSLGATLYAAVEGSSPYQRSSAIETLTALVTEEPPPARNAGPLKSVLNGLLRKDPASRMNAEEAERLLRRAAGGGLASRMWLVPKPRQSQARPPKAAPVSPPVPPSASAPAPSASASAPSAADVPLSAAVSASAPLPAPASKPAESPASVPASGSDSPSASGSAPVPTPVPAPVPAKAAPADRPAESSDEPPAPAEPAKQAEATAVIRPSGGASAPVTGEASAPAVPGGRRPGALVPALRRRPWLLVAAAVLALLLVAGAVALWPDSGSNTAQKPSAPTPTPAATPSGGSPPGGAAPAPATPGQPNTTGTQALPAGWHIHNDPTGFSVAVPDGWSISHEGTMVYFRDGAGRALGIDQTNEPHMDPVKDWQDQEQQRANNPRWYPAYERIRIEPVQYFVACADWEFSYDQGGTRTHVINRGFVTSDHQAYAIWWATPESRWQESLPYFQTITASFKPKQ